MTIHLERKKSDNIGEHPYQRLSYDIIPNEQGKLSISEISAILDMFAKQSDGEFAYCITDDVEDEAGNIIPGKILFGEDFTKNKLS